MCAISTVLPFNYDYGDMVTNSTYADFESLDCVIQQQYVAHNLCVLPVSLQLRRPDIVGSASRQAEARAHHAPTRVCTDQNTAEGRKG